MLWQSLAVLAMFSGPTGFLLRVLLRIGSLGRPADPRPGRAEVRSSTAPSRVPAHAPEILRPRSPSLPRWEQWKAAPSLSSTTRFRGRPSAGEARAALRRELARVNGQPLHVSPRFFRRMGLSEPAGALLLAEVAGERGLSVQRFGGRGCWEVCGPAGAGLAEVSDSSLSRAEP